MRYLLIWWIICPGHSQKVHLEKYQSYEACTHAIRTIPVPPGRELRAHCSWE
jgi:hypothetical protein